MSKVLGILIKTVIALMSTLENGVWNKHFLTEKKKKEICYSRD